MSIKLYADPGSQPCKAVEYTLKYLGADYEYIETLVGTGTRTPEYKKLNPVGKVPLIDVEGTKLRESGAILRYLLDTHEGGDALLPRDDKLARAVVDQWLDW